jgi:hypothetical protein
VHSWSNPREVAEKRKPDCHRHSEKVCYTAALSICCPQQVVHHVHDSPQPWVPGDNNLPRVEHTPTAFTCGSIPLAAALAILLLLRTHVKLSRRLRYVKCQSFFNLPNSAAHHKRKVGFLIKFLYGEAEITQSLALTHLDNRLM